MAELHSQKHYAKGSPDRAALEEALQSWSSPLEAYPIVNAKEVGFAGLFYSYRRIHKSAFKRPISVNLVPNYGH